MTRLVFHHDHQRLPPAHDDQLPVQLYGLSGQGRGDISVIGNPILDKIKRLGVRLSPQVMDFLSIALAVTAADTFVRREDAADGWTRQFSIKLPLDEPDRWQPLKTDLQKALHFLSGDIWHFDFEAGGYPPPMPYRRRDHFRLVWLRGIDCVSLFSGGLDSAIGAINLLEQGRTPLLVSHAYKGDKARQNEIAAALKGRYSKFEVNADPHLYTGESDITMRTRSLNFLAFAAVGAFAVQVVSQQESIDLIVPENGFISLNAPLTSRRIGTLSTRTTHPHFMQSVQELFDATDIRCRISNPYQFQTKGQMVAKCHDGQLLAAIVDSTVSCSHWKRTNQQCGICIPCIIRRAALHAGGLREDVEYSFNNVVDVLNETDRRDDLMALSIALMQRTARRVGPWVADSGPLPRAQFEEYQQTFLAGLDEVAAFLKAENAL